MASDTAGARPMAIAGRMVRERERLVGMTEAERAWRAQYLKDQVGFSFFPSNLYSPLFLSQVLSKREPVHVPEYWNARTNPIRRFYQAPLDAVWKALTPVIVSVMQSYQATALTVLLPRSDSSSNGSLPAF